jgi:hypothetical protein
VPRVEAFVTQVVVELVPFPSLTFPSKVTLEVNLNVEPNVIMP